MSESAEGSGYGIGRSSRSSAKRAGTAGGSSSASGGNPGKGGKSGGNGGASSSRGASSSSSYSSRSRSNNVSPTSSGSKKKRASKSSVPASVYLGKLSSTSLGKYQKHYRLRTKSDTAELLRSIVRHFEAQGIEEAEVVQNFLLALQKTSGK